MSSATNYAENQVIDFIRGAAMTLPTDWYIGLLSGFDSDDSPVEFGGSDYSRQPVTRSLAAWSGTQGAGSVLASSGTSHATSNSAAVDFGAGLEGTATHWGVFDAISDGELWFAIPIPSVRRKSRARAIDARRMNEAKRFRWRVLRGQRSFLKDKEMPHLRIPLLAAFQRRAASRSKGTPPTLPNATSVSGAMLLDCIFMWSHFRRQSVH